MVYELAYDCLRAERGNRYNEFHKTTICAPNLKTARARSIEILDKLKKEKGWLGYGIYTVLRAPWRDPWDVAFHML